MKPYKIFQIYEQKNRLYTKSILPGKVFFDEKIVIEGNAEYREFDPSRSKLAAAIVKGCTNIGIRSGDTVLYLGVSHGYTASFVSDIVGEQGIVYGIDPAPRVVRDLVFLAEKRKNIIPLLVDANHPDTYVGRVTAADIVYQDISQRNQAEIFKKNCNLFLKQGGYGLLAVKAKSIDVTASPKKLFEDIRRELEREFTVIDFRKLDPLQKDHCMIIVKKGKAT